MTVTKAVTFNAGSAGASEPTNTVPFVAIFRES